MVPADHRGRAYGIYNAALGIIALPASIIAGFLWEKVSPAAPFVFGASLSLIALLALLFFVYGGHQRPPRMA